MGLNGPLLQANEAGLSVWFGGDGLLELDACAGGVSGVHEGVAPVAVGGLAVGVDGDGLGEPDAGVGDILQAVVHVAGEEGGHVPGGIGCGGGEVELERGGHVAVTEGGFTLLHEGLGLGRAVVGVADR